MDTHEFFSQGVEHIHAPRTKYLHGMATVYSPQKFDMVTLVTWPKGAGFRAVSFLRHAMPHRRRPSVQVCPCQPQTHRERATSRESGAMDGADSYADR